MILNLKIGSKAINIKSLRWGLQIGDLSTLWWRLLSPPGDEFSVRPINLNTYLNSVQSEIWEIKCMPIWSETLED